MNIDSVRISQRGKEQLSILKRRTKIPTWNVLCRWALCNSLADPTPPRTQDSNGDTAIEIAWKTFGGEYADIYQSLIELRCMSDDLELSTDNVSKQLRLHLHRGLSTLFGNSNFRVVADLLSVPATRAPLPKEGLVKSYGLRDLKCS